MRRLALIAAIGAAAIAVSVQRSEAQPRLPRGYYLAPGTQLPDSLVESRADGRFRIAIARIAQDSISRKALLLAESVFPDHEEIERVADHETMAIVRKRLEQAAALPGNRWWWDSYDAVLTPYAVTGAAVDYYIKRLRARSDSANPFPRFSEGKAHKGSFSYRATVVALPDSIARTPTHLVRMNLSWSYWCGMMCAVYFRMSREVIVTDDGRIIKIEGDGKPSLVVS